MNPLDRLDLDPPNLYQARGKLVCPAQDCLLTLTHYTCYRPQPLYNLCTHQLSVELLFAQA